MTNCYSYENIAESQNPLFKNVDLTIVLTMKDKDRFKKDPLLLNLSKKTIFQINKGYKACKKPDTIKRTTEDVTHAYYTAFEYSKNYGNVIILEDDAEVLNYNPTHYKKIDGYIGSNDFTTISMGSLGFFTKKDEMFYETHPMAHTQAQIISKKTRDNVQKLMLNKKFIGHVDAVYFSEQNVLVYHEPLIVQVLSETENFKNWEGAPLWAHRLTTNIQGLRDDKTGWYKAYLICKSGAEFREYRLNVCFLIITLLILYYKK
tara:strand:+ start:7783 stop:8565 length:783 start_codon:yes stop_codon:yes gene_type:complete